jgi:hypothetical protein
MGETSMFKTKYKIRMNVTKCHGAGRKNFNKWKQGMKRVLGDRKSV